MACKHCGNDLTEHGMLSFRCPRFSKELQIKLGYIDGQEYEEEDCASTEQQLQPDILTDAG